MVLVDPDFLRVYQIPVVEGENFPENADKAANMCVVNRVAQKELGLDQIVGRKLHHGGFYTRQVVGVVENFHFRYPTEEIRPLVMIPVPEYWGVRHRFISIKLNPGNLSATVDRIEKKVKKVFPNQVFNYFWLNHDLHQIYARNNDPWEISLKFFTGFSIFIACLGLFGFAEYETARRTKEIGIRKAVGANRIQIAWHFIKTFLRLAVAANVIAWPLSFIFVRYTLRYIEYPYPFRMGVWVFIWTGVATILLTVVTISLQTFRAASVNPVEALRDE
jgi:putative ABC transport system permease protein